jgi:hypothetical protein
MPQRGLDDFAGMDRGGVDGAVEQLLEAEHPVAVVEGVRG